MLVSSPYVLRISSVNRFVAGDQIYEIARSKGQVRGGVERIPDRVRVCPGVGESRWGAGRDVPP